MAAACCNAAAEVEALKAKQAELIQKFKTVIDKSKAQATSLSEGQAREAELSSKVDQLQAEILRLNETISTQQQRIDELSSAELDLRIDIDSAKLEANEHAQQKQQAELDRVAVEARLADSQAARVTLEASLAAAQRELEVARAEVTALRVSAPATSLPLPPLPEAGEVASLLASQGALQADNAALQGQVQELQAQLEDYKGKVAELDAQHIALRTENASLLSAASRASDSAATTQAQAAAQAQAQVDEARNELAEAQREIARLKNQTEEDKAASLSTQSALLDGLRAQVSTLQGQVSTLTAQVQGEQAGRSTAEGSLAQAQADLEASKAAVARMKQMLLKQQSLLKAAKAADAAKEQAPSTYTLLSSLRVPPKVKEAVLAHTACTWEEAEAAAEGHTWDGLSWHLIARWDAATATSSAGAGAGEEGAGTGGSVGQQAGSPRCRLEWVPAWRVGPHGWVGIGEAGGTSPVQPTVLQSVLDACIDAVSTWPALRSAAGQGGKEGSGPTFPTAALAALGPVAGTGDGSPLPVGEAVRRLLSVLHASSAEASQSLTQAVRAGKVEVGTLREELAAHKARAAAAVRAAEEKVRAAQEQLAVAQAAETSRPAPTSVAPTAQLMRLQEQVQAAEEAKSAAEERVQALSDRVSSLQKRLEGAEASSASLRTAMQEQATRFAQELGERDAALATTTAALTTAQGKVHAIERQQAMAAAEPAVAPAGPHAACAECRAEADALRARVRTVEGQLRGAAAQLQAQAQAQAQLQAQVAVHAPVQRPETPGGLDSSTTPGGSAEGWSASEDAVLVMGLGLGAGAGAGAVQVGNSNTCDGGPLSRPVGLPSTESAGRATALLEKVLAGGGGGGAPGSGGAARPTPTSARKGSRQHRARGASTGEVASPGQSRMTHSRGEGGTIPWDSPAPGLALPTVRSVGDMSRGEEDFEADLALDEGEVLTNRLVAAEGELRVVKEENRRLTEQVEVLQESLKEADRAKQRAVTLLGSPGPSSHAHSTTITPAPTTPGQGKAVQASPGPSPAPASTPTVSLEYLKNAVVRYMASGSASERARMLPAIALLLSLSQGEVAAVAAQLEKEGASVPITQATTRSAGLFGSLFG